MVVIVMRRFGGLFLAGVLGLLPAACANRRSPQGAASPTGTLDEAALRQTATVAGMVRVAGWNVVLGLLPVIERQPAWSYPGMAAFAGDLRAVAATIPPDRSAPPVDPVKLIDQNPNFWRAYHEISPGDPLATTLHAGLLLAVGEAARANQVLTLAIGFGRMDLEQRKNLVRLQAHAQLMLHMSRRDLEFGGHSPTPVAPALVADRARAVLAVWPQSPDALAALAEARWALAGRPAPGSADDPWRSAVAALRRTDPLRRVNPAMAGPESAPLVETRDGWARIASGRAIGDDQALERFSEAAQAAELDETALTARALLAGRRGNFVPSDETFLRTSLQRLIGSAVAARICTNVFLERNDWMGLVKQDDIRLVDTSSTPVHPQLAEQLMVGIAEDSYWIESGRQKGADLAADYRRRGSAWAQLLNWDEGVADLRRALQLDPSDKTVRYALAVSLSDAGHFAEAETMFAAAMEKAPPGVHDLQSWGNHYFKQGRMAEAEAAFAQAGQLDPGFAYASIMRHLACLRQNKPGTAAAAPPVRDDPWGASLLDYLAGRIDELTLFGRLEPEGGMRYSEQECELHFVLGELALSRGDTAEARRQLHSCLGTGISSFVEYALAWYELQRLDALHGPGEKSNNRTPPGKEKSSDVPEPA